MKQTINQRIDKFLTENNISSEEYRKVLGVKNKQQISSWRTSVEDIPDKHILKTLLMYPNLSARWLLNGEGDMLEFESVGAKVPPQRETATEAENKVLDLYEKMIADKNHQIAFLEQQLIAANKLAESTKKDEEIAFLRQQLNAAKLNDTAEKNQMAS